jgi:hypothetical protein
MTTSTLQLITDSLGGLFSAKESNGYLRIRTPFLYPDGDVIDLFIKESNGVNTITDLGETARWLRMQSLSPKRSPKQNKLLEDVCLNHGLEFYRGMFLARAKSEKEFAPVFMRVAQGVLRASDLWFTMRTRSVETACEEVELFLLERGVRFERSQKIVGRSGRTWQPDFHTRLPDKSSLVYVLSTGSQAAARRVTEHVVTAWHDLNNLAIGPEALQFVSLFDDSMDVWSNEDFRLLENLSEVARWSQPDEFLNLLAA